MGIIIEKATDGSILERCAVLIEKIFCQDVKEATLVLSAIFPGVFAKLCSVISNIKLSISIRSRFLNLVKKLIQKLLQEVKINEEMSKITKDLPQSLRPMIGILFDENWSTQTRSKIETKMFQI